MEEIEKWQHGGLGHSKVVGDVVALLVVDGLRMSDGEGASFVHPLVQTGVVVVPNLLGLLGIDFLVETNVTGTFSVESIPGLERILQSQ